MRLFGECGFDFLPETDLQQRPGLEMMTVGLHLCALELTACIALAGQLPEFFPLRRWILAVKKSFLSQEVVVCSTRAQWDEVRAILQSVNTAEIILKSKHGTPLWTKTCSLPPIPLDDEFPLRAHTPPLTISSMLLHLKYGESSQSGPYAVLAPLSHVLMALSAMDLSHRFQHERSKTTSLW